MGMSMDWRGLYGATGQVFGWGAWAWSVAGVLWWNGVHPFLDTALIILAWPLLAAITVLPLVKRFWPLLIAAAPLAPLVVR